MTREQLSDQELKLLRVVQEGRGDWDARQIDLTFSSRYGPAETTVLGRLQHLERLGYVRSDSSRGGVGGRWAVEQRAMSEIERPA